MGCDIHLFAEERVDDLEKTEYKNGELIKGLYKPFWMKIGKVFKNLYFNTLQPIGDWNQITTDEPWQGRNYSLFAFLADVRNNHELKPLSQPRGLPKDVSDDVKKESDEWGVDGHSHSYFTLQELLDVDWDFTVIPQSGFVDPKNYKLFKKTGRPNEWCQGTLSKDYKKIKWNVSLREFLEGFIESLYELKEWGRINKKEPKDIRLVFWFDN